MFLMFTIFSIVDKISKSFLYLFLNLFSILIYVTFILFLELESNVKIHNLIVFLYFPLKFRFYLFALNFNVISYLNWILLFFHVVDFVLCFILKNFMVIPSEQNVFELPQLGFSLAKFIGGSFELCW